jgi:hypothetical protein
MSGENRLARDSELFHQYLGVERRNKLIARISSLLLVQRRS